VKARGITNAHVANKGLFGKVTDPDPYFKISCRSEVLLFPLPFLIFSPLSSFFRPLFTREVQTYFTRVVGGEANPEWNEDCTFIIEKPTPRDVVHILLLDRSNRILGNDGFMGRFPPLFSFCCFLSSLLFSSLLPSLPLSSLLFFLSLFLSSMNWSYCL